MLGACLAGCGGHAVIDSSGSGGAAGPSPTTTGSGAGSACEPSPGVRLCGGDGACPALPAPACPGYGCTPALDRDDFSPSPAGVCWADLPSAGSLQCNACLDGQVCVQRYDDQLLCVEPAVCAGLAALGAAEVCRYADKARYDGTALPAGAGACPGKWFCGGDCGACPSDGFDYRCSGRSPLHPFGVCLEAPMDQPLETAVAPCALSSTGDVILDCSASSYVDALCAVYSVAPEDDAAARRWGMCMSASYCTAVAGLLPGGLRCFDEYGQQVAP